MTTTTEKHELFEELDAFDPNWQMHYKTILGAAIAANVRNLYVEWLDTEEGKFYENAIANIPDIKSAIEEHQKALAEEESKLPYGYGNIGSVRGSNWN